MMVINALDSHKCYIHEESGDAEWWFRHIGEKDHEHKSSRSTCKDCGKEIMTESVYEGKLFNRSLAPDYCEEHK